MSKKYYLRYILILAYVFLFVRLLNVFMEIEEEFIDIEYIFRGSKNQKLVKRTKNPFVYSLTVPEGNFTRAQRFEKDYKFILKWSQTFLHFASSIYTDGQKAFLNCTYSNCYLSNDLNLLVDIRNYDAIIFDMENDWSFRALPRASYQKYIFAASEASSNFEMCHPQFDNFFNLTWTYKLDSDISWTYLSIFDKNGTLVGPKIDMNWIEPMEAAPDKTVRKFISKSKAAAWFVSFCQAPSGRHRMAKELREAMKKYDMKLDIFGGCGDLSCPKNRFEECLDLLERDYYFYLSFENSLSEDYVTEKLLHAVQHYTVPIVYGGANYSRFLPPNSYIDARLLNATEIAKLMSNAIKNPDDYHEYFRWHNYYEYRESHSTADICNLCKILNEDSEKRYTVRNFRKWWNPNYNELCYNQNALLANEKSHELRLLNISNHTNPRL